MTIEKFSKSVEAGLVEKARNDFCKVHSRQNYLKIIKKDINNINTKYLTFFAVAYNAQRDDFFCEPKPSSKAKVKPQPQNPKIVKI